MRWGDKRHAKAGQAITTSRKDVAGPAPALWDVPHCKRGIANDIDDLKAKNQQWWPHQSRTNNAKRFRVMRSLYLTAPNIIGGSLFPFRNESDAQA